MISRTTFHRDDGSDFIMPFDHHFKVKGFGTVLTGTILSGKVKVGDTVEIIPVNLTGKVKSIRIFKEEFTVAGPGDRVGIAISGIDDSKLYRGCMACTPGVMKIAHHLLIRGKINKFFKHSLNFKSQVHLTAGMLTVPARIYPFEIIDGKKMVIQELKPKGVNSEFTAYIYTKDPVPLNKSFNLLLSRLDLSPQELRIASRASIEGILDTPPELFTFKEKVGKVKNQEKGIIEGLAQSFEGAKRMVGKKIHYTKYLEGKELVVEGKIIETFGTKGNLKATFKEDNPVEGTAIVLLHHKPMKITTDN
jgi:selenocysteine-specific elongation factor